MDSSSLFFTPIFLFPPLAIFHLPYFPFPSVPFPHSSLIILPCSWSLVQEFLSLPRPARIYIPAGEYIKFDLFPPKKIFEVNSLPLSKFQVSVAGEICFLVFYFLFPPFSFHFLFFPFFSIFFPFLFLSFQLSFLFSIPFLINFEVSSLN